ncbi:MAG TPA: hypothetical protein ENH94_02205 [Phycisphaerales bacterium]|nr:hypothetical protein [Phycisphaerales bacterium]
MERIESKDTKKKLFLLISLIFLQGLFLVAAFIKGSRGDFLGLSIYLAVAIILSINLSAINLLLGIKSKLDERFDRLEKLLGTNKGDK